MPALPIVDLLPGLTGTLTQGVPSGVPADKVAKTDHFYRDDFKNNRLEGHLWLDPDSEDCQDAKEIAEMNIGRTFQDLECINDRKFPGFLEKFGFKLSSMDMSVQDNANAFKDAKPTCGKVDADACRESRVCPLMYKHPYIQCSNAANRGWETILHSFTFYPSNPGFKVNRCVYCRSTKSECDLTSLSVFNGVQKDRDCFVLSWAPAKDAKLKEALARRELRKAGVGYLETGEEGGTKEAVLKAVGTLCDRIARLVEKNEGLEERLRELEDNDTINSSVGRLVQRLVQHTGFDRVLDEEREAREAEEDRQRALADMEDEEDEE